MKAIKQQQEQCTHHGEYTAANARKLYCEISERKRLTRFSKKQSKLNPTIKFKFTIRYGYYEYIYDNQLKLLSDYPWYVRIWARLTYKI